MSLNQKTYYFLTDRSTFYRYLVDNSSSKPNKHLYYPQIYEKMNINQIEKYQKSLVHKFLWWSFWNKEKLSQKDWQICYSKIFDIVAATCLMFVLARSTRVWLFRHQFMTVETMMEAKDLDVKFWKALFAYTTTFSIGFSYLKSIIPGMYIKDLAFEYLPNYDQSILKATSKSQAQKIFQQLYLQRFQWLKQESIQKKD